MKSDDLAEYLLKQLGFELEKLPVSTESGKKMPDFLIRSGAASALVEAKLKGDDPSEARHRTDTLNAGEVYASDHELGRNETISTIVRNASKQLGAAPGIKSDFKVLFFLMDCINSRVVSEQLVDTLYGRTSVIEYGKAPQAKSCYFYRNSDFFRRNEIDAAIIGYIPASHDNATLRVCLNPYSPRYEELKLSELLLPFKGAVLDPIDEEKAGRAYIPDANIERKEHEFTRAFSLYDPVLQHLAKKYNTSQLIRCDFKAPEFSVHQQSR